MSYKTPHPNFRQKLLNQIESGNRLNKMYPPNHSKAFLSFHQEKDPFFNIFEKDVNDYHTFHNKINMQKISEHQLSFPQKQFMKDQWKLKIAKEILEEKEVFEKNEELKKNIEKIKSLDLLRNKELNIKNFKFSGKSQYVMNDYHTRSTNPGFSRNKLGNFFTN